MNLKGRLVGGAGYVAGNCHTVILKENHRAEDQKLRSPQENHIRVFPLHLEGRVSVGSNHKVQELDGAGSCVND